jgi:hypothetical protein
MVIPPTDRVRNRPRTSPTCAPAVRGGPPAWNRPAALSPIPASPRRALTALPPRWPPCSRRVLPTRQWWPCHSFRLGHRRNGLTGGAVSLRIASQLVPAAPGAGRYGGAAPLALSGATLRLPAEAGKQPWPPCCWQLLRQRCEPSITAGPHDHPAYLRQQLGTLLI